MGAFGVAMPLWGPWKDNLLFPVSALQQIAEFASIPRRANKRERRSPSISSLCGLSCIEICNEVLRRPCAVRLPKRTTLTVSRSGRANLLEWQNQTLPEMSCEGFGTTSKLCFGMLTASSQACRETSNNRSR